MDLDINLIRNAITLAALVAFLAIVGWAYAPSRKRSLEQQGARIVEDREP